MIKIFTDDELYNYLYQDDYELFQLNMDSIKSRIKYFEINNGYWRDNIYVCEVVDDLIVGVLCYSITKNGPTFQGHNHFISYVSVDPNFQNKGIATKLIEYWVKNVYKLTLGQCALSEFTENGFNYLRNKFISLNLDLYIGDEIKF